MTPTPEMIEAAILGAWENTVQFDSGVSWEEWRENNPDAAGEFSKGIEAGLKAALAAMWRPVSEYEDNTPALLKDEDGDMLVTRRMLPSIKSFIPLSIFEDRK